MNNPASEKPQVEPIFYWHLEAASLEASVLGYSFSEDFTFIFFLNSFFYFFSPLQHVGSSSLGQGSSLLH